MKAPANCIVSKCVHRNRTPFRLLQPVLLGWLIRHYEGLPSPINNPLVSGGAIVGVAVIHIFIYHPFNFLCRRLSLQARISSSALVYRKVCVCGGRSHTYKCLSYSHLVTFVTWFTVFGTLNTSLLVTACHTISRVSPVKNCVVQCSSRGTLHTISVLLNMFQTNIFMPVYIIMISFMKRLIHCT